MAPLTIGISGCSRSGKSSLAAAIEAASTGTDDTNASPLLPGRWRVLYQGKFLPGGETTSFFSLDSWVKYASGDGPSPAGPGARERAATHHVLTMAYTHRLGIDGEHFTACNMAIGPFGGAGAGRGRGRATLGGSRRPPERPIKGGWVRR